MMTYSDAMKYIEYTNTLGSTFGLDAIRELLVRLGNPQDEVRVIHIAGTNGKGSICAFLDEILEESGYTVGRYISPTIFTYLERFQINKKYMREDVFARYLEMVRRAADEMVEAGLARPTSFETETAVAFCYFRDMDVDFLLLETGMGGELDATNVCEKPLCTIIASISMDHMAFLGDTLPDIYRHKLGIMRRAVPCVSYQVDESIMSIWVDKCDEMGLAMCDSADAAENPGCSMAVMTDFSGISVTENTRKGIVYTYRGEEYRLLAAGKYQIYNSVTAVETAFVLKRLGYDISAENIRRGVARTCWRGRFQKLSEKPLIYVDGAHNEGGWRALRQNIDDYFENSDIIYICGVFKDKEYGRMLDIMMPRAAAFIAVQPDNPRALSRYELANCAKQHIDSVYVQDDVLAAVEQAKKLGEGLKEPVIVIFGSLSFIGPVIERMTDRINAILSNRTYRELMELLRQKETGRIYCRHGLDHLVSVARIAYIMNLEERADIPKDYVYAAALLHDIGRADPGNTGREHHLLSVELAEKILAECGFDRDETALICDAIGSHNTDGDRRSGLAYFLYRADKLERSCFACEASDSCYWSEDKKNRGVIY